MQTTTYPESSYLDAFNEDASGEASVDPRSIKLENILVPLDLSHLSLRALRYAVPLARHFKAKITLLYVHKPLTCFPELPEGTPEPPDPRKQLLEDLKEIRHHLVPEEVKVKSIVYDDFAADGIVEVAREICADLIIMTTHGRGGLHHLLMGSTTEKIMKVAPCPVLVLSEHERELF